MNHQTAKWGPRRDAIFDMRLYGCSFVNIGKHFGISAGMAWQIYRKKCRMIVHESRIATDKHLYPNAIAWWLYPDESISEDKMFNGGNLPNQSEQ